MNEEKGPRVNRSAMHKDQREAGWEEPVGINYDRSMRFARRVTPNKRKTN